MVQHNLYSDAEKASIVLSLQSLDAADKLWFGVTDIGMTKQESVHTPTSGGSAPWLLRLKSRKRRLAPATQMKIAQRMLDDHRGLVIFPCDYNLCVVDVDSPTAHTLYESFPPLHGSRTRSAYGYSQKPPGCGHLWYRRPRTLNYLRNLPSSSFLWRRQGHKVDFLYDNIIFVPPGEVDDVLKFIAEDVHSPSTDVFPTEYLALHHHAAGHRRDDALFNYILDQYDQGGDLIDERWVEVADTIGHTAKHGPEKLQSMLERARSRTRPTAAGTTAEHETDPMVQDFDLIGLKRLIDQSGLQFRYNQRAEGPEVLNRKSGISDHWMDLRNNAVWAKLQFYFATTFRRPKGKNATQPWDFSANRTSVYDWFTSIAYDLLLHDPWADYLDRCKEAEPMDIHDSFMLRLMSLKDSSEELRMAVTAVERNMLLALHGRLANHINGLDHDLHFPVCPVLIGPPGVGKSRYCRELGIRGQYHTTSASFEDSSRVWAEKYRANFILEIAELADMLGSAASNRTQKVRGVAKDRLEATRFTFRAAYAPGATGGHHSTAGVIIGTSNRTPDVPESDGLVRRLAFIDVVRHPDVDAQFKSWPGIVDEWLPRAMRRASDSWDDGFVPENCEDAIFVLRKAGHEFDAEEWADTFTEF